MKLEGHLQCENVNNISTGNGTIINHLFRDLLLLTQKMHFIMEAPMCTCRALPFPFQQTSNTSSQLMR